MIPIWYRSQPGYSDSARDTHGHKPGYNTKNAKNRLRKNGPSFPHSLVYILHIVLCISTMVCTTMLVLRPQPCLPVPSAPSPSCVRLDQPFPIVLSTGATRVLVPHTPHTRVNVMLVLVLRYKYDTLPTIVSKYSGVDRRLWNVSSIKNRKHNPQNLLLWSQTLELVMWR